MSGPFYAVGAYKTEIVEQGLGKSKTGTPQFVIRFKVLSGASGEYLDAQYERTMYMYFTEKTVSFVKDNLEQLGFTGGSVARLDPSNSDHHSFVGLQVNMYCKHEMDQSGNMQEKWQLSRGASALKVEPLEPREMRELDALFGKTKPAAKTAPRTHSVLAEAEITDDDIPF